MPEVALYVETLSEIDFQDLIDVFAFTTIDVQVTVGEMSRADAKAHIEEIRHDLSFDGDEWKLDCEFDPAGFHLEVTPVDKS